MHSGQQTDLHAQQGLPSSSAPGPVQFAFQSSTPGPQRPLAEQLTPVLPHKQQQPMGRPADRAQLEAAVEQVAPTLSLAGTPHGQDHISRAEQEQQSGRAPTGVSQALITLLAGTPHANSSRQSGEDGPPDADPTGQKAREASPAMRGALDSPSKHSRSSSEGQRGSRLGAAAIIRSATAPPQLCMESQRGSNSPKKPVPKCSLQQGK